MWLWLKKKSNYPKKTIYYLLVSRKPKDHLWSPHQGHLFEPNRPAWPRRAKTARSACPPSTSPVKTSPCDPTKFWKDSFGCFERQIPSEKVFLVGFRSMNTCLEGSETAQVDFYRLQGILTRHCSACVHLSRFQLFVGSLEILAG